MLTIQCELKLVSTSSSASEGAAISWAAKTETAVTISFKTKLGRRPSSDKQLALWPIFTPLDILQVVVMTDCT